MREYPRVHRMQHRKVLTKALLHVDPERPRHAADEEVVVLVAPDALGRPSGISSITVSSCLCNATAWTSAFTAGSLSLRITILFLPISPRNSKMPLMTKSIGPLSAWMTVLAKNSVSIA